MSGAHNARQRNTYIRLARTFRLHQCICIVFVQQASGSMSKKKQYIGYATYSSIYLLYTACSKSATLHLDGFLSSFPPFIFTLENLIMNIIGAVKKATFSKWN